MAKRHEKGKFEMKLKYKAGDRIRYNVGGGVEKVGVIRNIDEDDSIAPYSVNGVNVREADIIGIENVELKKKRGRPAKKATPKEAAPKEEPEPVKHDDLFDPEISINKKYEALKKNNYSNRVQCFSHFDHVRPTEDEGNGAGFHEGNCTKMRTERIGYARH